MLLHNFMLCQRGYVSIQNLKYDIIWNSPGLFSSLLHFRIYRCLSTDFLTARAYHERRWSYGSGKDRCTKSCIWLGTWSLLCCSHSCMSSLRMEFPWYSTTLHNLTYLTVHLESPIVYLSIGSLFLVNTMSCQSQGCSLQCRNTSPIQHELNLL